MEHKKIAVLIDGGYFKTVFHREKKRYPTAEEVVSFAEKIPKAQKREEIFRIYYYDAPFYDGKLTNPINGVTEDYRMSRKYQVASKYQKELAEMDLVAFRKGHLAYRGWVLSDSGLEKIKRMQVSEIGRTHQHSAGGLKAPRFEKSVTLDDFDLKPNFEQKTVDIKIGLDIAWLSSKRLVDALALVTADTDFVPAMKAARREGLHVIVIQIGPLNGIMREHADEVRSIAS